MLSDKHRKFAEGIVTGLTMGEVYQPAHPKASSSEARANDAIAALIGRMSQ
jgi:hypothetical protein